MRPTWPRTCHSRPCRSRRRRPLRRFSAGPASTSAAMSAVRPAAPTGRRPKPAPRSPTLNGSFGLFNSFDAFKGTGSYFFGLQAGYNYVLPSRFLDRIRSRRLSPEYDRRHANHLVSADRAGKLQRHGSGIRHGKSPRRLRLRPLAGLWDRRRRLGLRQAARARNSPVFQSQAPRLPARPKRRCCGDGVGPPAPALKSRLRRIGPPSSNIWRPSSAADQNSFRRRRSRSTPI